MSRSQGERVRLEEVGTRGTVLINQRPYSDSVVVRWDDGNITDVSGSFLSDADWDADGLESQARWLEVAGWSDEADERVIGSVALRRAAALLKEAANGDR